MSIRFVYILLWRLVTSQPPYPYPCTDLVIFPDKTVLGELKCQCKMANFFLLFSSTLCISLSIIKSNLVYGFWFVVEKVDATMTNYGKFKSIRKFFYQSTNENVKRTWKSWLPPSARSYELWQWPGDRSEG